jgi:hypothetical protein
MEVSDVKTVTRMRMFFALGLIAAVLVAVGLHPAAAAGGPSVKTGYYRSATKCSNDGENICSTHVGSYYKLLNVQGKNFTPLGPVRVMLIVASNGALLADTTTTATAKGTFGLKYPGIDLCIGGKRLEAMAIDLDTGRSSNIANAFACSV